MTKRDRCFGYLSPKTVVLWSKSSKSLGFAVRRHQSERGGAHQPPGISKLSEQQLGLSLLRAVTGGRADAFAAAGDVMYERTSTAEIDFVGAAIEVPFESKYVERSWRSQSRALAARYGRGIVATRNILDTDGDIWALPTSVVVWLLGA
jgi:uncharacterized protein